MTIKLGEKIKMLRKRDGRRQDDLANALGVTNQAVSRWEANKGYPDMEMIPAIANYFHVSIDELFGYDNERETRLSNYIAEIDRMLETDGKKTAAELKRQEEYVGKALAEFPNEWRLQIRMASVLNERATRGRADNPDKAIIKRATELYEKARANTDDTVWRDSITRMIVDNCLVAGDAETVEKYALESSPVFFCREVLRKYTPDDSKTSRYRAEAILALIHELTELLCFGKDLNRYLNKPDAYLSLARLYECLFESKNYGAFNSDASLLYLRAASICAENSDETGAMEYFDKAYQHRTAFEEAYTRNKLKPDSTLLRDAAELPTRYFITNRDYLQKCLNSFPEEIANKIKNNPKYCFE